MAKANVYSAGNGKIKTLVHAHSAAVEADEIVLINGRVLIAYADADANADASYIYEADEAVMPKLSTDVVAAGDILYWDDGNSRLTATTTSNTKCAIVRKAAGNGDTEVNVELVNNNALT